jgi:hypothetical protein
MAIVELEGQRIEVGPLEHESVASLARILWGMTPLENSKSARRRAAVWSLKRASETLQQLQCEAERVFKFRSIASVMREEALLAKVKAGLEK